MHTYCFNQVTLRLRWFSEFLNCITKASCKSIWMVELYLLSWSGQPPIKPYEWNIVSSSSTRLLFHFVSTKNIHLTFSFSFFSPSSFVYISIADTVINFICFNWAIILVIHFFFTTWSNKWRVSGCVCVSACIHYSFGWEISSLIINQDFVYVSKCLKLAQFRA